MAKRKVKPKPPAPPEVGTTFRFARFAGRDEVFGPESFRDLIGRIVPVTAYGLHIGWGKLTDVEVVRPDRADLTVLITERAEPRGDD